MPRPSFFTTSLTLPAWWVRAFEASVGSQPLDALACARSSGLTPAMSAQELGALAILLSEIQAELLALEGKPGRVRLTPSEHRKHAVSTVKSRRFSFEKVLQGLSGLRVLEGQSLRSVPLFGLEEWKAQGSELLLELEPSPLGAELLFGYAEPYADLLRFSAGGLQAHEVLGDKPPLVLWRSLWLDFQGTEQQLLLRLEKAIQWEFRWLQLEGIFGLPLAQLFDGIDVRPKRGEEEPVFQRRLRLLARFGRRLCEHGVLAREVADRFLVFDEEASDSSPVLAWQLSREKLLATEADDHLQAVGRYLCGALAGPLSEAFLRLLGGNLYDATLHEQTAQVLTRLQSLSDASAALMRLDGNRPLLLGPLFLEWSLRQMLGHALPLPDDLAASPAGRCTSPSATRPLEERFALFVQILREGDDYMACLRGQPLATVASLTSRRTSALPVYLERLRQGPAAKERSGAQALPPKAPVEARLPAREVPAVSNAQIHRIAAEELKRMRHYDPQRFADLRRNYFSSLPLDERRLILDVQKRMQPDMFEEHLKPRLLKFMIENPSAWRSAEQPARGLGP